MQRGRGGTITAAGKGCKKKKKEGRQNKKEKLNGPFAGCDKNDQKGKEESERGSGAGGPRRLDEK